MRPFFLLVQTYTYISLACVRRQRGGSFDTHTDAPDTHADSPAWIEQLNGAVLLLLFQQVGSVFLRLLKKTNGDHRGSIYTPGFGARLKDTARLHVG